MRFPPSWSSNAARSRPRSSDTRARRDSSSSCAESTDATGTPDRGGRGLLARRVRAAELDLRRARSERHAAGVRRRHARAAHHALRLLPPAAAPERRRSRRPPAQTRLRAGAAQAAARFPRAERRRLAHPALLSPRLHPRQRLAHHVAGDEEVAAARGSMTDDLRRTYDAVAGDYLTHIFGELAGKAFDRQLLDEMAGRAGDGLLCDLGCGPGHVARYLHERGAHVVGVDLSPGMVAQARALTPAVPFQVGDMRALDVPDASWQAIVAMYSIIHIPKPSLPDVFREMKRVLVPGGVVLVSFHIGNETVHRDEWWGNSVSIDFFFFQPAEIVAALEAA